MYNKRIFVKQIEEYDFKSKNLLNELQKTLSINSLKSLKIYNIYDMQNISNDLFNKIKFKIFARINMDEIFYSNNNYKKYLAIENLPLQFDNRADSAMQLIKLYDKKKDIKIKTGIFIGFNDDLLNDDLNKIKNFLINPIDNREKKLDIFDFDIDINRGQENTIINNFINYNNEQLKEFIKKNNFSLIYEDIELIQKYFKKEKRNPNNAELMMFDIYWSDHCRHTTFNTKIKNVYFNVKDKNLENEIKNTFNLFLNMHKKYTNKTNYSLMDISLAVTRKLNKKNKLKDIEKSDEVNAISIEINLNNKKHYLVFKNETHNHPTEIEPIGGASTCLGGAIRDILAARAYCFGGIRISGCGNILDDNSKTLKGKLPQKKIAKEATIGFSSYGNQLGLPTLYVNEYYNENYKAKHLECGAVIGVVSKDWVKKLKPEENDLIMLLGGDTGIDGIGGASGSSKSHNKNSVTQLASEVQKGNPIIARKFQRLFKTNKKFIKLIKKCNDFGAGGASVAIGELADGVEIYLDKFKNKYLDIKPDEILFSESQERMAMVINPKDKDKFIEYANNENLDAYIVGKVTKDNRIKAFYKDNKIIDISRSFLNSNGYNRKTNINVELKESIINNNNNTNYENEIKKLKNKIKKGLVETFDSTICSNSLINTMGGKYLLTQSDSAIANIPNMTNNISDKNVIVSIGFNPEIASKSVYHMGFYSIIESISKIVSKQINIKKTKISLQEYFSKLTSEKKWSQPFIGLLGAFKVLNYFNIPVVGGKDSMSGTFENIDVIPTILSFAINIFDSNKNIITNELKKTSKKSYIYLLHNKLDENNLINLKIFKKNIKKYSKIKNILSATTISEKNIKFELIHMAIGNKIGININSKLLNKIYIGDIIFQTKEKLKNNKNFILLGETIKESEFIFNKKKYKINDVIDDLTKEYINIYPYNSLVNSKSSYTFFNDSNLEKNKKFFSHKTLNKNKCVVLHPVFPGTNCEFDVINKFKNVNDKVVNEVFIFKNQNSNDIDKSINGLYKKIKECDILNLSGGFSLADEPDGSAKYITCVLSHPKIKNAIENHLKNKKLILGICNGFQALINSGLLPYGKFNISKNSPALKNNPIGKHISTILNVKYLNANSPWIKKNSLNKIFKIPISHGEGSFSISNSDAKKIFKNNQLASVYTDDKGNIIDLNAINPNNSDLNIEGIVSLDGLILGKMGHSERIKENLYKNIQPFDIDPLFENGVNYILGDKKNV